MIRPRRTGIRGYKGRAGMPLRGVAGGGVVVGVWNKYRPMIILLDGEGKVCEDARGCLTYGNERATEERPASNVQRSTLK